MDLNSSAGDRGLIHRQPQRSGRQPTTSPPPACASPCGSSTIRVGLFSDSALFRSGLRSILLKERALVVLVEAAASSVRELVRTSSPDILIVDAQSDGALVVCGELRRAGPRPRVILAGADGSEAWAVRALKAGARGILAKSASVENLLKAVRVVHQGEIWASNRVIALSVEELATHSVNPEPIEASLKGRLSCREHEIVQLVATGLSNLEVGYHLNITEPTVKAHLTHIFQKLALRDRGQLAAFYHRNGSPERSRS